MLAKRLGVTKLRIWPKYRARGYSNLTELLFVGDNKLVQIFFVGNTHWAEIMYVGDTKVAQILCMGATNLAQTWCVKDTNFGPKIMRGGLELGPETVRGDELDPKIVSGEHTFRIDIVRGGHHVGCKLCMRSTEWANIYAWGGGGGFGPNIVREGHEFGPYSVHGEHELGPNIVVVEPELGQSPLRWGHELCDIPDLAQILCVGSTDWGDLCAWETQT